MSELIKRQDVIELIKNSYYDLANSEDDMWAMVADIEKLPVIETVPVVHCVIRCKDCKFSKAYYHGSESNLGMFTYLCTQGLYGMNADDYCSRAERKEG